MNNSYFKVGQNISDVIKALLFNNVLLLIAYLIIFRFLPHTLEVQIVLLLIFLYVFVFTILSYGHKKRLIISKSGFLILHKQGKDVLYERYPFYNFPTKKAPCRETECLLVIYYHRGRFSVSMLPVRRACRASCVLRDGRHRK